VPIGHISSEILAFAENEHVDLIITGSHGVHGLQLLLGSTSNAILHGAKCDVLAVRFTE
jgi:universal stress protein A